MSKIKGMDKAQKRWRDMAKKYPQVTRQAMYDAVIKIEGQATDNVTGGNPLYVSSNVLRSAIHHVVKQIGPSTIGTVGIPKHAWYGKVHELGKPSVIYPKKGKYLKFQVGRGMSPAHKRKHGKWVTVKSVKVVRRPWLHPAYIKHKKFIRKRFERVTQDLLRAAS